MYLVPIDADARFPAAAAVTLMTLFVVGALRTVITKAGFVRSGMEMLFVGALAAAVAYGVGALAAWLT